VASWFSFGFALATIILCLRKFFELFNNLRLADFSDAKGEIALRF